MKKIAVSIFLGIRFMTNLFGQSDSLRKAILNYQNTKYEIINNGRKMTLDKFYENDKMKVSELVDYLVNTEEDNDYISFFPGEKWLLFYWTGEYEKIINGIIQYDSAYIEAMYKKIRPIQDFFMVKLKEKLREERIEIKNQINSSKSGNN